MADYNETQLLKFRSDASSPMFANSLDLYLSKESFYDDEEVLGHAILTIRESLNPRRLTLAIVGEMSSLTVHHAKKDSKSLLKKLPTFSSPKATEPKKITRTFTASKDLPTETSPPVKKTMTRTFTMTSSKTTSTGAGVGKIIPVEEVRNRELFCHYIIPVFTFKTALPAGVYKIPFKFMLSSEIMPSVDYNRENIQFAVSYTAIAELEEKTDEEDSPRQRKESFFLANQLLKSKRELKIFRSSTRHQDKPPITDFSKTEVVGKVKLPEIFCFRPNEAKVKLRLEKNSFKFGDIVNFELEGNDSILKPKKTKLTVNLVEELNKLGDHLDSFSSVLDSSSIEFGPVPEGEGIKKVKAKGSIPLSELLKKTFRTSSDHVEHFFEVLVGYSSGLKKQTISLRVPIVIGQVLEDQPTATGHQTEKEEEEREQEEEDEEEDAMIVLPLAKFKLEERYNLLSKTVQALEEKF